VFQSDAIQKLHGDERLPVLLADVMNRADVGVIQRRCGLGFALKTSERLWVSGNLLRQKLESDKAVQPHVLGLVHDTHPAATQLLDDAVVRDGLADHADAMLGALQWEVNEMRIAGLGVDRNREKGPVFAATTASFPDVLQIVPSIHDARWRLFNNLGVRCCIDRIRQEHWLSKEEPIAKEELLAEEWVEEWISKT
jgi:hypothetical protein